MPKGVRYPGAIHQVIPANDGSAILIIREDRSWEDSERRLLELHGKIETCTTYVLLGQLGRDFPHLAGKPVTVHLWCLPPGPELGKMLDRWNAQLARYSLRMSVRVVDYFTTETPPKEKPGPPPPWLKIG